jgi:hypothetical protein
MKSEVRNCDIYQLDNTHTQNNVENKTLRLQYTEFLLL